MTRVAIIGGTGQLGRDLVNVLPGDGFEVVALGHDHIECADAASVAAALSGIHPDIVVNCAAYVRVDDCESQSHEAFQVNALGALHVARACADLEALCVYVSTDYVFDGEKDAPYTEQDEPNPINVYGASKLSGEYLVRQSCPKWLIVRVASLFGVSGARGKGGNFIETMLTKARAGETLRVVDDVIMSPTYTWDVASILPPLLRHETQGLLHLTNAGACSWYTFAKEIFARVGLTPHVMPISSQDYVSPARRPANSALRSTALDVSAPPLRPWQDALHAYLTVKDYV